MSKRSRNSDSTAVLIGALLRRQSRHDRLYHADIHGLATGPKLQHFALHFAKYVGRLAGAAAEAADVRRTLVDSFIIALSASNALGIGAAQISRAVSGPASSANRLIAGPVVALELAHPVGRLAKACEALDHLEDVRYGAEMRLALLEIIQVLGPACRSAGLKLSVALRERWRQIEKQGTA